ncbi:MAG: hypothetical protein FWH21_02665 [Kiritimatiellaeota bacterium]|nr:hypothetical protein [Kiritimatiellota bacterium]
MKKLASLAITAITISLCAHAKDISFASLPKTEADRISGVIRKTMYTQEDGSITTNKLQTSKTPTSIDIKNYLNNGGKINVEEIAEYDCYNCRGNERRNPSTRGKTRATIAGKEVWVTCKICNGTTKEKKKETTTLVQ